MNLVFEFDAGKFAEALRNATTQRPHLVSLHTIHMYTHTHRERERERERERPPPPAAYQRTGLARRRASTRHFALDEALLSAPGVARKGGEYARTRARTHVDTPAPEK
jgi:hypothetical protein